MSGKKADMYCRRWICAFGGKLCSKRRICANKGDYLLLKGSRRRVCAVEGEFIP